MGPKEGRAWVVERGADGGEVRTADGSIEGAMSNSS